MSAISIYLAVEDELSEWVLRRILSERPVAYRIETVFQKNGFGFLKKMTPGFNNMANACPVLLLTDLDTRPCAPELLAEWLNKPKHPNFLLRVAVREVEAWLLASSPELRKFLGIRREFDFPNPEALADPKMELLKLSESSPKRQLRESITRREDGNLKQGPAYNSTLAEYVNNDWNLSTAADKCESLRRLLAALTSLERQI